MRDARRVIQPRSYALALGVALSLALLQGQTCDRGNTDLTNLEFEVDGGPDLIVGFDTLNRSYDVSTSGSPVTVRAQAVFGVNDISWQWLVGTTTIGSGPIGTGSGEVTIPTPIPDGESVLRVVVKSNQVGSTASGYYTINITNSPWGTPKLIETDTGDAANPQVAVDPNGDAVAVWRQHDGSVWSIYANRLTSGVWGTPALLETGTGDAFGPQVAVDPNGDAVAVWTQYDGTIFNIYANQMTSGVWGTPALLETGTGDAWEPQVAVDPNGDAVAVWRQHDGSALSIYANRLTSGVWGTAALLETDNTGHAREPQVAVDPNGDAVAVWRQFDGSAWGIYANRMTSGVWGTPELLETDTGHALSPQVAVDPNGDAVAVWHQDDGSAYSIYANRMTSGVWGTAALLETDNAGHADSPQVAVDPNGDAVAVWYQSDGSARNIYANRLVSGVWGTPELLETDTGLASAPQVAVDPNGDGVAVWTQSDGSVNDIYANRLTGGVWGTAELLDTGAGTGQTPQVAVDPNGDGVAVWTQSGGSVNDIYANRLQ